MTAPPSYTIGRLSRCILLALSLLSQHILEYVLSRVQASCQINLQGAGITACVLVLALAPEVFVPATYRCAAEHRCKCPHCQLQQLS